MTTRTLVVAPHPDDEILGCGGTLLRRKAEGAAVAWVVVTGISVDEGWAADRVASRAVEIDTVAHRIGFDAVYQLGLPTTKLDALPMASIVQRLSEAFSAFRPTEVFIPSRGDAHSDHHVVHDACAACVKWFRYPSVERVLAYETPSETDFGLPQTNSFVPTVFIDVEPFLEQRLELMSVYASEVGAFPFPRSLEAIRALATVRGAAAGFGAAEAFQLLRQREEYAR